MTDQPHPKLGFRTAAYRKSPLDVAFASIAAHGYNGAELCLEHPQARPEQLTLSRARRICSMAQEAGLELSAVSYHGDSDPQLLRRENQRRILQLGPAFDTDIIIFNAAPRDDSHPGQQWDEFSQRLAALLPAAEDNGLQIALEPEPGHFLHSTADMIRLLEQIGHPSLKVNLDVGHAFLTDADVTDSILQLAGAIVHTHIEGMPAGEHKHLPPGEGDLDLRAVATALREIGYDGYYTVDLFDIADNPDPVAEQSIAALSHILAGISGD